MRYETFDFHDSKCHLLYVDLTKESVRPVISAEQFPFHRTVTVQKAIDEGAIAAIGGGFNLTLWAHRGISDEPLHCLAYDGEIWTTGTGAGGYGCLLGAQQAWIKQNRIEVTVWRPDHSSMQVEHINWGHDGAVVAFTPRGGSNEYPMPNKHYVSLGKASSWVDDGETMHRKMLVENVTIFSPPPVDPDTVVLEGRWPMKLDIGDIVTWTQHLGAPGVRHIVSGATGIILNGINRVPTLNLDPTAPHGPDNWYVRKNPREMLGVTEDGKTLIIAVVEGRIPTSRGLRLKEAATMLLHHGAYNAVNTDGGGSAFLWMKSRMHKNHGIVANSCYGTDPPTIAGLRPAQFYVSVFA